MLPLRVSLRFGGWMTFFWRGLMTLVMLVFVVKLIGKSLVLLWQETLWCDAYPSTRGGSNIVGLFEIELCLLYTQFNNWLLHKIQ